MLNSIIKILLLTVFVFHSNFAYGQGFDWQWSARMPFQTPRLYWGVSLQYGFQFASGDISFLEDKIQCPKFTDGSGNNFAFGLNFEYWEKLNRFAYRGSIQYGVNTLTSKSLDNVPYSQSLIAKYENKLELNFSKIGFKIGGKYRIANTHFNIGADLMLSFIIDKTFKATEEILGPPEIPPFSTNPPSYKRDILNGEINTFNLFQLEPSLSIGYDLQLGLGTYISPHFTLLIPTKSMFSNDNLTNFSTSFGIIFYRRI